MKITREEFKELVKVCKKVEEEIDKATEYINQEVAVNLAYPVINWLCDRLGYCNEYGDLLTDVTLDCNVPISWEYDSEGCCRNVVYSKDLDKIYDAYLAD